MANTTNYNWETPDDTDLVKDGAAAIRTLGNSIDTTTKALNPETTLGDIAYRSSTSNTNTRLPIGSNGQILGVSAGVPAWINNDQGDITEVQAGTGISVASGTGPIPVVTNTVATAYDAKGDLIVGTGADTFSRLAVGTNDYVLVAASGETTGLKWSAPSSGALTLIKRASFSNVANTGTTFDDVFSSSYKNYIIKIENFGSATSADDVQLQFRYAGPTTQTTGYYGNNVRYIYNSTTITNSNVNDQAQATLNADSGTTPSNAGAGTFFLDGCSGSSDTPRLTGMYMENITANSSNSFFGCLVARVYTGFLMKSSSTNITGTIAVYGLA